MNLAHELASGSHNRLCDMLAIRSPWTNITSVDVVLFYKYIYYKTNQLLSGFILNCNIFKRTIYIHKYWLPTNFCLDIFMFAKKFSRKPPHVDFQGNFPRPKLLLKVTHWISAWTCFTSKSAHFLRSPAPMTSDAKRFVHQDLWVTWVETKNIYTRYHIYRFSLQSAKPQSKISPPEKKTRENWWLVTPGLPKSTIHWTETLPQKPTKNPGGESSTMLPGFTWIQLLGPFQSS